MTWDKKKHLDQSMRRFWRIFQAHLTQNISTRPEKKLSEKVDKGASTMCRKNYLIIANAQTGHWWIHRLSKPDKFQWSEWYKKLKVKVWIAMKKYRQVWWKNRTGDKTCFWVDFFVGIESGRAILFSQQKVYKRAKLSLVSCWR